MRAGGCRSADSWRAWGEEVMGMPSATHNGHPAEVCPDCLRAYPSGQEHECGNSPQKMLDRLKRIELLARRHWHPGCNTGAQTLAGLIVKICEEK